MNRVLVVIREFLKNQFSLAEDTEREFEIVDAIKKGVPFRGINLYTLIFAVLICSVGLNVNSTAVIIGAMLISPLMGPIMGLGLGVGINDFELMKKAAKNLALAVIFSVLASCIYFLISPLSDVQSELLARTSPTIWDVLIAIFGGLTGVLAGASKQKGNAIPGVAIATALMPPLCTAGFGIATLNFNFVLGALYLFFINSVMISLTTFLVVKVLNFRPKEFIDKQRESFVKRVIYIILAVTILPSIYTAYLLYNETTFNSNVNKFIQNEIIFESTQVISKKISYESATENSIELFMMGEYLTNDEINYLENKLEQYKLKNAELIIRQGEEQIAQEFDINAIKTDVLQDLYEKNQEILASKDEKIELLENEVRALNKIQFPVKDMCEELQVLYPDLETFSIAETYMYHPIDSTMDTLDIAILNFSKNPKSSDLEKIETWLGKRLDSDHVKLILE